MKYFEEIDILRAISVVVVIINHFNPQVLPAGHLGVDVFFVISGFVVTASLIKKDQDYLGKHNAGSFLLNFYKRRIKRLYPALLLCISLTGVFAFFTLPSPDFTLKTGLTALLGMSNLFLLANGMDYFSEDAELNLFTHTWSLGVEEQFYIVFPLILIASFKIIKLSTKAFGKFVVLPLCIISGVLFFTFRYKYNSDFSFYLMPSRFWQLGLGVLCYTNLGSFTNPKFSRFVLNITYPLLLVLFSISPSEPGLGNFAVCLVTVFSLVAIKSSTQLRSLWSNRLLVTLGKSSYSLYLWHWPAITIFRNTIGIDGVRLMGPIALTIAASFSSYFFLEQPLRRCKWLKKNVFITLLSISFLFTFMMYKRNIFFLGKSKVGYAYLGKGKWNSNTCGYFSKYLFFSQLPANECLLKRSFSTKVSHQVYTFGNSYNSHLIPAYVHLNNEQRDLGFHIYTASGCPIGNLYYSGKENNICRKVYNDFIKLMKRTTKRGDSIILSTSFTVYFKGNYSTRNHNSFMTTEEITSHLLTEFSSLTTYFRNKGVNLFIVSPVPILKVSPELCYQPWSYLRSDCHQILDKEISRETAELHSHFKSEYKINYINIYDPIRLLIESNKFDSQLYFDKVHLSDQSKNIIGPILNNAF